MPADSTRTSQEGVVLGVKRALPRKLDLVVSIARRSTVALRATVFQRPSRLRFAPGLSGRSFKSQRWIWAARAWTEKFQSPGCESEEARSPVPLLALPSRVKTPRNP